ncbi:hypothetical protein FXO37_14286 [Capsicum annuum]|nr:hypothetical protein FXO37_14286 [Capsicum annuum]
MESSSSYELNAAVSSWEFLVLFLFRPLLAIAFVLFLLLLGLLVLCLEISAGSCPFGPRNLQFAGETRQAET